MSITGYLNQFAGRFIPSGILCALGLGAGLISTAPQVYAQGASTALSVATPVVTDRVITSIQQYWDLTAEQKTQPQAFEIQGYVTYF